MSGFGANPVTTTQGSLATNQFPTPSVAVPGTANGDLTTLEGGPASTDSNGNSTSPVSAYIKNGADVAKGSTTDVAWTSGAGTEIALLKKLVALLAATLTISGTVTSNAGTNASTASLALETGGNLASIKADADSLLAAVGAISDAAYSGSGNGSEIALLKKLVAQLAATLTVSGTVGVSSLPALAAGSAVIGHIVADSGSTTAVTQATGTNLHAVVDSGTVTANVGTTNGLALDTSVSGVIVSQGSTTSGEKGPLVQGAVTTSAPTYTTTQTSPISLTTAGAIRVDASATTQPISGTVTANAGTNLNTSLLALETGGNLATLAGAISSSKVQANVAQINGVAPTMGNGVSGTGVQRVTIASDSTGQVALAAGSAVIGHVIADSGSTTAVTQATAANLNGTVTIQATTGTSLVADQTNSELRVSNYVKTTTAGDTALTLGQATMANSLPVALASNQGNVPANIAAITAALTQANQIPVSTAAAQGKLTLTVTSNSGTFAANLDNTITFSGGATVARRIRIQNESAGTIYWETDATASTSSPSLVSPAANAVSVEWIAIQCTTLHIWVPSGGTTTLNGTTGVKVTAYA